MVFAEEVVKRKLRSLRTSYTRELNELRRREAERAPGEPVKKPRWKWFHLMDPFLRPYCSSRKDVANSNRVGCLSAAASRPFFSRLYLWQELWCRYCCHTALTRWVGYLYQSFLLSPVPLTWTLLWVLSSYSSKTMGRLPVPVLPSLASTSDLNSVVGIVIQL